MVIYQIKLTQFFSLKDPFENLESFYILNFDFQKW